MIKKHAFWTMLIAAAIIGTQPVAMKYIQDDIPPVLVASFRYLAVAVALLIFSKDLRVKKQAGYLRWVRTSTIFQLIAAITIFVAVEKTQALNVSLAYLLGPVFVYVGSVFLLSEPSSPRGLWGSLIALLGGFLLIGEPLLNGEAILGADIVANGLLVLGLLTHAIVIIHTKRLAKVASIDAGIAARFGIAGFVMLLIFMPQLAEVDFTAFSVRTWAVFLYLVLINGAFALSLYYRSLVHMKVKDSASLLYIDPLVGSVLGMIILGETLSIIGAVAVVVIIAGIAIAHPAHSKRMHFYLDPHRHYFHAFLDWVKKEVGAVEHKLKKYL